VRTCDGIEVRRLTDGRGVCLRESDTVVFKVQAPFSGMGIREAAWRPVGRWPQAKDGGQRTEGGGRCPREGTKKGYAADHLSLFAAQLTVVR
jgi:hypothetical protein